MKNNKHDRRNSKLELSKESGQVAISKWEDLLQMKERVSDEIKVQLATLSHMAKTASDKLESNPELKNEIRDVCKAYGDVATDLRATMEKHITFKDNDVIDYKKGNIYDTDKENDEVFEYIQISGEYLNQSGRVKGLLEHTLISIYPKLGAYDKDIEKFKDVEKDLLKEEGEKDGE